MVQSAERVKLHSVMRGRGTVGFVAVGFLVGDFLVGRFVVGVFLVVAFFAVMRLVGLAVDECLFLVGFLVRYSSRQYCQLRALPLGVRVGLFLCFGGLAAAPALLAGLGTAGAVFDDCLSPDAAEWLL